MLSLVSYLGNYYSNKESTCLNMASYGTFKEILPISYTIVYEVHHMTFNINL